MNNLTKAKVALYIALLDVPEEDLSEFDYEFMGVLLKDPDIREFLKKALDKQ